MDSVDAAQQVSPGSVGLDGIARRLQRRRAELGLSQAQVAKLIEVSRPAYTQWELGVTVPDLKRLEAAARALKMSPGALAFGAPEPDRDHPSTVTEIIIDEASAEEVCGSWPFPKPILDGFGVPIEALRVTCVSHADGSERPVLYRRDVRIVGGPGTYVILVRGALRLVRLQRSASITAGDVLVITDGDATYTLDASDVDVRGLVLAEWTIT